MAEHINSLVDLSHSETQRIFVGRRHADIDHEPDSFKLNEHHNALVLNYLRFAKFQRGQCIKSIKNLFEDAKDTKFPDATYTVDEIRDILDDISAESVIETESELMHSAHTNVLLLQQVCEHAQKWHLDLDADLAELENRELLDKVKNWEDEELSSQPAEQKPTLPRRQLAPLLEGAGGPAQLLRGQLEQAQRENNSLRERIKTLEVKATKALETKDQVERRFREEREQMDKENLEKQGEASAAEVRELTEAVETIKFQMANEQELNAKTQKELSEDLTSTKHQLLDVRHCLTLAEKELEKKFSETGAYKNMKKMLCSKNDQIKELRAKLKTYEKEDCSD